MSGSTVRTQYGGIQFGMVNGIRDGKGIANIGTIDIPDGKPFSDEQLVKSALGQGLMNPTLVANGMYTLVTEQTSFGVPSGNPANQSDSGPVVKMVSQKVIKGEQSQAGSSKTSGNPEIKQVSQKVVMGIQEPITSAESKGTNPNP